jgi:hypothetical protein
VFELYKRNPSFVLGFHGCDEAVGEDILAGKGHLKFSTNRHDWLGDGVYFWEGDPKRALEWATKAAADGKSSASKIKTPFVVGAIIDLGDCCSLFDVEALDELKEAWEILNLVGMEDGSPVPQNKGATPDRVLRYRDRAVIEFMHTLRMQGGKPTYQTVRAAFGEGGPLYEGALLTARQHIQIAVREPACIKGYFRPIKI